KKSGGGYSKAVYEFFAENFPPSANSATYNANSNKAASTEMSALVGNIFNKAGLSGSAVAQNAFHLLYFIFMENFAADGGKIFSDANEISTIKFINNFFSAHNLWGIRPNLGITPTGQGLNGVFESASSGFYSLGAPRVAFSTLANGGRISLTGQNSPPGGATHEIFYRLTGQTTTNPILNISLTDNGTTMYYVVVPNDAVGAQSSSANRQFGRDGANVFPLKRDGTQNFIDTRGQNAYLFAATIFRNVQNISVDYSWTNTMPVNGVIVYTEAELRAEVANAGSTPKTILLAQDIILHETCLRIPIGTDITLKSVGEMKTLSAAHPEYAVITLMGTLTIDGIIVSREADAHTHSFGIGIIIVDGHLTIFNGSVTRHRIGIENLGTTIMYGGKIFGNNNQNSNGSGVYNGMQGIFTMNGGEISDNTAGFGGGVENFGTFNLNGGEISNNSSVHGGGVSNMRTFNMTGGKISNNTAMLHIGGGVMNAGTFNMTGGEISGNSARIGGGIHMSISHLREPGRIFIGENAIFKNNFAEVANVNQIRFAQDDEIYNSQIRATQWSAPFTQGFNNYDIAYVGQVWFANEDGSYFADFDSIFGYINKPDFVIDGDLNQLIRLGGAAIAPRVRRPGWVVSGWDGDFNFITENTIFTAQWSRLGAFIGASATSGDAAWLARHLAGHAGFELTERAKLIFDMNGDGELCPKDLTILVKWLVGYDLAELIRLLA
ncbi:MAG: hypothetical protein FWD19_03170, partial [Defluviitaleaceae bacterium]|nr:hypothetical protein [Defluviitaleaceae bacterium]